MAQTRTLYRAAAAMFFALAASTAAHAAPITGIVYVQPIQVCDSKGLHCADQSRNYFDEATDTIWGQAGIRIDFFNWLTHDLVNTDSKVGADDINTLLNIGRTPDAFRGVTVVLMWFLPSVDYCGSDGTFWGCTYMFRRTGNSTLYSDIFISDLIFANTRMDTIAHELGHTLGMGHCGQTLGDGSKECGAGDPVAGGYSYADYLMADGAVRSPATSLSQITEGERDKLTSAEIMTAASSDFVFHTPEPGTLALAGLGVLVMWKRRRARAAC